MAILTALEIGSLAERCGDGLLWEDAENVTNRTVKAPPKTGQNAALGVLAHYIDVEAPLADAFRAGRVIFVQTDPQRLGAVHVCRPSDRQREEQHGRPEHSPRR